MRNLIIDNYSIKTPILDILYRIRALTNGQKLKDIIKRNDEILVTCPIHKQGKENKPALNIYIGDNSELPYGYYHCFVCNNKGKFEQLVAHCLETSIGNAKNWLINTFEAEKISERINLGSNIKFGRENLLQFNINICENIDGLLSWNSYLQKRKLSRELCEAFNVKYDPKTRDVVFPIYDLKNNLALTVRRSIDTKTFKITKNAQKPLYCLNIINNLNLKKFLIVEGPIDCLTCYMHNVPAVATLGAMTREQIQQINKLSPRVVYIATDNDKAGEAFAQKIKEYLAKNIFVERINLPKDRKDVNDLTEEEWENLIKKYNLPKINQKLLYINNVSGNTLK